MTRRLDKSGHPIPGNNQFRSCELLEREENRDDPELAEAMASLTISDKVRIKPSRRQYKESERDGRTVVQQLVASNPQSVVMSTSYKRKEQKEVE